MEEWEIKYITQQGVPLISNILCDTVLLASLQACGVLSDIDAVKIVTAVGRFDQSKTLLDIFKVKVHGYEALVRALISCNQSGAYNILLDGFTHERFLNLRINLGNGQYHLRDFLSEIKIATLTKTLRKTLLPISFLNFCLEANADHFILNLTKDTIPSVVFTYTDRSLLKRPLRDTTRNDNLTFRERKIHKTFLNVLIDSNIGGLYIYGKQGSGKTSLLNKIGNILSQKYPDRILSFVHLPAFVQLAGRPLPCTQDDPLEVLNLISKWISHSQISRILLLEILHNKNKKLELLFDGLDEVHKSDIDWVAKFISTINQFSFARVFLSVGSKSINIIERMTDLGGFDIVDFTNDEQDELVSNIWYHKNPEWDKVRLRKISTYVGNSIRKSLNEYENEICGKPLQCTLIAEKYSRVAKIYCKVGSNISIDQTPQVVTNLFELYKSFIESTFGISLDAVNYLLVQEDLCSKPTLSKRFHLWVALSLTYPKLATDYNNYFEKLGYPVNFSILPTDILKLYQYSSDGSEYYMFAHQTYSDYLVAECMSQLFTTNIVSSSIARTLYLNFLQTIFQDILVAKESQISLQNFIFAGITQPIFELHHFQNGSLDYFLDNHLRKQASIFITKETAETFYDIVTSQQLHGMISACLHQNLKGTLNLLFEILQNITKIRQLGYKTYLSESDRFYHLLLTAVEYSDLSVVKLFTQLCTNVFDYDVLECCKNLPANSLTTVHIALRNSKLELTNFLISKMFTNMVPLLQLLICNSQRDSDDVLKKKIEMVGLLISKDKNLIAQVLPMLPIGVHVVLTTSILNIDPQFVGIIDYYGNTVAHLVAKNVTSEDYHNFVLFILNKPGGSKTFTVKNSYGCTALHEACYCIKGLLPETVEMIITKSNFDVTDRDDDGNNILFSAASGNGSQILLEKLINLGTPYKTRNDKNRNALHIAIVGANIEAARFLLRFWSELNTKDND